MRLYGFLFLCLIGLFTTAAQTITLDPPVFSENTEITVTVSDFDPMAEWGVNDLYLWAWYFDSAGNFAGNAQATGIDFGNSPESAKFTDNGDGTYSYTFTPAIFYNDTGISRIGLLVKSKDGSQQTTDYLYDVGGYQIGLTSPSKDLTVVSAGSSFDIEATASEISDWNLYADDVLIDTATSTESYSYTLVVNQTTNFRLTATNGGDTLEESFTAAIAPTVTEEAVPAGLKNGINPDPSDPTKATLVFYAPGKEFVHVIGDFNNWLVNPDYLMKKDSATDQFWLELTGLTPQSNHLYQYLVEYDINVADPYSTLVLDGYGNDAFIDETTFPALPDYPAGQSHAITVLRTGDAPYNWQVNDFEKPKKTDLVIYELLVRDFDALHSFDAVRSRLDYLQELGVNAIELMPVNEFDGNESWGYNPAFHMALDKYYGTADALKQLVDEAHARGMAVILDVVYNHASGQHPYYRMWNTDNGGTGGQASQDNPFFNPSAKHSYSVFNDFNHQSQATRDYVNQTLTYWIEEFRLDGMRWDLTKGFTQNCSPSDQNCTNSLQQDRVEVLQGYADTQWASDPDFYVIFEHLGGIQEEILWAEYRKDEGKGIMLWNKLTEPYNEATLGYHENGKSDFSGVSYLQKGFVRPSAVSYMESHDEERLMFKNLEFGNSGPDNYSVKNLATALQRMEAAGAFFFTVPGPKMIWQFGELGYDVSIDFNGRVGNKPIRWEYADEPARKAVYDTWADLVSLRINEPIFETTDFDLDLGNSNGLKKIHLALASATADEIGFVTIIGNFGVDVQEINPEFQETGVWFEFLNGNRKYIVTDPNKSIQLQPGEFRIFGNNPTALFPDENIPDDDHDGVENSFDNCPATPLGSMVDVNGCVVFNLPADNFTIETASETCRSSDNGSITVIANQSLSYTANLSGPTSADQQFTEQSVFDGLTAGQYTLCITVDSESSYQQCYELEITEPEDLSVSSKVNNSNKLLSLELKGGSTYTISLDGRQYTTTSEYYELPLKRGANKLKVSTGKECQGVYEETIYLSSSPLYPNPVSSQQLNVEFGESSIGERVQVDVYDLGGRIQLSTVEESVSASMILDISGLAKGTYLVGITTTDGQQFHKLLIL
ncbi:alpha-amylase family glycosyl hydrolase [Zeaxanthinibacter enoshimensis]|uniref:Putative secreted protein (Por secretion system target) n=1 Tax=Zeaxanthinibacter enoshimensis TaxID=392009 RepID=A0A4R6TNU6_9FLAO|nr:alpha-amylase family glycosyl hydrolase [Zeaxanthinibacter enoshimensis]TDQ33262.1 putative secreted protein (Por secretion system target) [Zeaxanthinibacter enoshimensis]